MTDLSHTRPTPLVSQELGFVEQCGSEAHHALSLLVGDQGGRVVRGVYPRVVA
jgi:hypothetical protein